MIASIIVASVTSSAPAPDGDPIHGRCGGDGGYGLRARLRERAGLPASPGAAPFALAEPLAELAELAEESESSESESESEGSDESEESLAEESEQEAEPRTELRPREALAEARPPQAEQQREASQTEPLDFFALAGYSPRLRHASCFVRGASRAAGRRAQGTVRGASQAASGTARSRKR